MMNTKRIFIALLVLLSAVTAATAQIKSGTALQITISGVPAEERGRFTEFVPVSSSGTINMPFIGLVQAAGLRGDQLAKSLEDKYKKAGIYTQPTFQVIDNTGKRLEELQVVVGGYVRRSGSVPYMRDMNLWQAIQAAGGANEFGSMKRVQVVRGSSSQTFDCEEAEGKLFKLKPGDSIEVPQKRIIFD